MSSTYRVIEKPKPKKQKIEIANVPLGYRDHIFSRRSFIYIISASSSSFLRIRSSFFITSCFMMGLIPATFGSSPSGLPVMVLKGSSSLFLRITSHDKLCSDPSILNGIFFSPVGVFPQRYFHFIGSLQYLHLGIISLQSFFEI